MCKFICLIGLVHMPCRGGRPILHFNMLLTLLLPSCWLGGGQHPPYSIIPFQFLDWGEIAINSSPCPSGGRPATSPHALLPSLLLLPCWLGGGQHPPYSPSPFFLVRGRPASSLLHPSFEISGLGGDCHQFPTMPFLLPSSSALNG